MSLLLALQNLYPLGLSFAGFWRADYTGSPWPGTATAGASGGRDLTEATTPPGTGTTQNGYTPADFDGTNDLLTADLTADDYVSATAVTIQAVVYINSAAAAATYAFDDACIVVAQYSGIISLGVSSSGVRFGCYTTGGYVETAAVSLSTGAWHRVQARYDGANVSVRVDGGTWTDVAATDPFAAGVSPLLVGTDIVGTTAFLDGNVLELLVSEDAFSDVECDALDAYAVTRYGLGAAVSNISATVTTTLTTAPIVRGTGNLASAVTTTLTTAPLLAGRGDLAAACTTTLTLAPVVRGTGAVSSVCTTTLTTAAILAGRGDLAATVTTSLTCTAILVAAGSSDMTCTLTTSLAVSALLAGRGDMAPACTTSLTLAPIVRGRGDLAAIATTTLTTSALLAGSGRISAACTTSLTTTATMQAVASFSATCTTGLTCSAVLGGRGDLSAACVTALTLDASLFGFGDLSAAVTTELTVSATFEIPPVTDVVLYRASSPGEVLTTATTAGCLRTAGTSPGETRTSVASAG